MNHRITRTLSQMVPIAALLVLATGCASGGPFAMVKSGGIQGWDLEAIALTDPAPCPEASTAYCVSAMRVESTRVQRLNRADITSRITIAAYPPHSERLLAGVSMGSVVRANGTSEAGLFTIYELALPTMELEQSTVGALLKLAGQWLCPQLTQPSASATPAVAPRATRSTAAVIDDSTLGPTLLSCRNALTDTSIALARLQSYPQCRTQYASEAMVAADQHFSNNPIR